MAYKMKNPQRGPKERIMNVRGLLTLVLANTISANGVVSKVFWREISKVNKEGPYVGIVVPNAFELDPLLHSPSFVPHNNSSISDDDDSEGDDVHQKEYSSQPKKKALVSSDKKKSRENFQMAFANALTVMSESSKKVDILESISSSQVVWSSCNATVGHAVGQHSEDNNKLMSCLSILEKLEGIYVAPFTKVVKASKYDSGWRDVFLPISNERKEKKNLILDLRIALTMDIQLGHYTPHPSKGEGVQSSEGEDVQSSEGEDVQSSEGEDMQSSDGEDMQSSDGEGVKPSEGEGV
ncbi:hypothetical protein JHK86_004299 [Glycine max]|nr:hypothetical protein JHK86_004299 [Glycine max]